MSTLATPLSHDDLTPAWFTDALGAAGIDAEVASFTRRSIGAGVGLMSRIEIVELAYSRGEGPDSVLVKLATAHEGNLAVCEAFDIYRREVLVYRDLASRFGAGTPTVIVAQVDNPREFVLVLEDLSDYRLGNQVDGCGADDARACVVALAKLHAEFWDDVERDELDFIPYESPSIHSDAMRDGAKAGWDPMTEIFGDVVPEHMRASKDRYLAAIPALQQWGATAPMTVTHGDFRMDNLFFATQAEHEPVMAVDWQGCLRTKGIRDVAYLLSQSMGVELRREHERELVALWHRTLVDLGVTGYSSDQAWEDYRRSVLTLWIMVVVIAGTLDPSNDRGRSWMTEMIRRSATAIDDLHLLELLAEFVGD